MNLDELRNNLSGIDRKLVELIAERQKIVAEIGKNKRHSGTGTRDYAREKDVLDMGREQAEALGVDPDLAEGILRQLIRTSLESQERDRVIAEGKGDGRRVLLCHKPERDRGFHLYEVGTDGRNLCSSQG